MATYVLVHGAWGGSYGFRLVRPKLTRLGHDVFTPSLTGLGERSHLTSPQVDLTLHVRDVVHAIVYEDLTDVVLLGYSYGGFVVTGAIEHVAERVAHLVYLDAFVPQDGESLATLAPEGANRRVPGVDWLVPPIERAFDDPVAGEWNAARRQAQSVACFTEPVHLPRPLESYPFTRTYIKATGEPRPAEGNAFWRAADRAKASPEWRYAEIETNHMIPANRPHELAALLLELA